MPFPELGIEEARMRFVVRAASGAEHLSALCREFGISRPTGRKWRNRYLASGRLGDLRERSRRPHCSPQRSTPELEQQVVELRQRYGWGARKLRRLLLDRGVDKPAQTLHRILKRHDLVNPRAARPGGVRFERSAPNELWQMDIKGPLQSHDGVCEPLSILDDHSRYAVGLYPLRQANRELIQQCLEHAFAQAGVPAAMLMDRGSQWFSAHSEHGLTGLAVWLIKQGVRLIHGRVRHPQTQGKVERFHGTIEAAVRHHGAPERVADWGPWLERFRCEYNEVRPHEALDMETPATRWRPSEKCFEPEPEPWHYPEGVEVRRLNEAGCLAVEGRQWFVCEALAGEQVGLERLPLETIVVRYRDMYIRELDLGQHTTLSLVRPAPACGLGSALGRPAGSRGLAQPAPTSSGSDPAEVLIPYPGRKLSPVHTWKRCLET